jgi:lysophospholipase L1-like esterase
MIAMTPEDIVLLVFAVLPPVFVIALVWFFRSSRFSHNKEGKGWPRLVAGNLLVLCLLLSLLLLGGEIYYRYIYDTTDSFGLTKTTRRWFGRHFQRNRTGFRDNLQTYDKRIAPGKRRITFIGDSFTAGHGVPNVDDRFANLVRAAHPDWEVHVLAQNGWETGNELDLLRGLPPDYALDQVVLVYCLNDICDLIPKWQAALKRIYQTNRPRHLFKHSYFLNTLYFRFVASRDPDVVDYFGFTLAAYDGATWHQQESRLRQLAESVKNRGGRLRVVTFPFLHNLDEGYAFEPVHEKLARLWKSLGVPDLDLMELYRSKVGEDLVVGAHDAHPNEHAHRLAAKALVPFLEAHLGE